MIHAKKKFFFVFSIFLNYLWQEFAIAEDSWGKGAGEWFRTSELLGLAGFVKGSIEYRAPEFSKVYGDKGKGSGE